MSQTFDNKKADDTAAANAAEQKKEPAANAVPGGQVATNWSSWFSTAVPTPFSVVGDKRQAERDAQLAKKEREEKGLVTSDVTGYGRPDQKVLGDDGQVKQSATGTVTKEEEKGKFSWLTGMLTWGSGNEKTEANGDKRTTTSEAHDKTIGIGGKDETKTASKKVEVVDVKATAAAAKKQLEDEKKLAEQEIDNQEKGAFFWKKDSDPAAKRAAEEKIAKLDSAIAQVDAAAQDGEALKQLCQQHKLVVEPKYKVVEHTEVTEKNKLELAVWKGSFEKSNEKATTQTDDKGAITTSSQSSSTGMNLSEGKLYEKTSSNTETKKNADGTSEMRTVDPTKSTSVEMGGGELKRTTSQTTSNSKSDADGENVSSSSKTTTSDKSIIAGEDGIGVKQGGGTKTVTTKGENSTEVTKDAHAGVTDKGVLGDASIGYKESDGKLDAQVKGSVDGALLIEVIPPDDDSPFYRIVTTVRAGVGGSASLGDKKDENAKTQDAVSGGVKLGATLTYMHAMTHDQAVKYMNEADKAEAAKAAGGGGEYPEFGIIEKLRALAHGENAADPRAVLGSSAGAADMAPGDSVKLVLSASAEAKLGVKRGGESEGVGGDVSVGGSKSRTVTVAKGADGMVTVAIGFADTEKIAASLSASAEGVAGKIGASQAKGDGDEYTFKLNPGLDDYQTCYDTILGTWSRDTLKTLGNTEPLRSHIEKKTATEEHKGSSSAGIGGAGVMLNTGNSQQGSSEISKTKDGPEGKVSGGQTDTMSISVADVNLVGVTQTNTASSTVDKKGELSTDLQRGDSETDLGRTLSNAGKTVKGWFGIKEGKETKATDVLKGALEKTPGERLKELLEQQYTRLSGYKLHEADLAKLVQRAGDYQKWMHACESWRALEPMERLRDNLLSPNVDMSLVTDQEDKQQIERAAKLAIAKALADFMESSGGPGMDAIVNVLQNWGATFNKASTAEDIGTRYEWPSSMGKYRVIYEKAEKVLDQAPTIAAELLEQPDGKAKWHELSDKLIDDLDKVHAAIAETPTFRSERARAEMLNDVSKKKAGLSAANKFFDRAGTVTKGPAGEITNGAKETKVADDEQGVEALFANERITTLLVDLAGFKAKERELFNTGFKQATSMFSKKDAHATVQTLYELYEFWVARIKELRGCYQTSGLAPEKWQISSGPESRHYTASTEPYVDGMIDIWQTAGGADYDTSNFPSRMRARFSQY